MSGYSKWLTMKSSDEKEFSQSLKEQECLFEVLVPSRHLNVVIQIA